MWGREGKLPTFDVFSQQNVIKLFFFLHMLSTGKSNGLICLIPFRCATWLRKSLTSWHVLDFIFLVQDNDKRAVFEKFYVNKFGCQIFQRKSSCSAIGTEQDGRDEDGDQDDEQVKNGGKILRKYNHNSSMHYEAGASLRNQVQNYNYDSWSHPQVRKAVFMYAHDNIAVVKVCAHDPRYYIS